MPVPPQKDNSINSLLNPSYLKSQAQWIRDVLDPHVARDGPEAISVEDALYLDQFIRKLLLVTLPVQAIRTSRIHLALLDISGRSTRWPHRLVERADTVVKAWEAKFGCLKDLGIELLGPGGRLESIVSASDMRADTMLLNWIKQGVKLLPSRAWQWGDLGFKPGDWWINPLFAFREGIIDSGNPSGGIVADNIGAYAILLTNDDEISSPSSERFVYRSRNQDKGRYRLTAATRDCRQPVRVLRSHTLRSFWSPRAGIRYDGMHRVVGWSVYFDKRTAAMHYDITFERLSTEVPMSHVLCRPFTCEVEDYKEHKRLRQQARQETFVDDTFQSSDLPSFLLTTDGAVESKQLQFE